MKLSGEGRCSLLSPVGDADCFSRWYRFMQKQRKQPRIRVEIPLRITIGNQNEGSVADAVCTDFSRSGFAFKTEEQLFVGDVIRADFLLGGTQPMFSCQATLLYRAGSRYGAYLVGLGPLPKTCRESARGMARWLLDPLRLGRALKAAQTAAITPMISTSGV